MTWQGLTIGRYRIVDVIGKGGFGEVYRAVELGLDRTVAIKFLVGPEELSDTARQRMLERFRQEARIIASLDHYNILPIFAFDHYQETPYLVMPLMYKSLSQKLRESQGLIPIEKTAFYIEQVAAGLQYAHDRNIVHRDIKPPNILLNVEENRAVIADFGIARIISSLNDYTSTSIVVGSPLYMAPEQQSGAVGRRTDIYSFGLTIYELLTGVLPREHSYKALIPPSRIRGELPPVLDAVILKALAKDPDERYERVDEFAAALGEGLANSGFFPLRSGRTGLTPVPMVWPSELDTQALPPYSATPRPNTPSQANAYQLANNLPLSPAQEPTINLTPDQPVAPLPAKGGLQFRASLAQVSEEVKPTINTTRKRGFYLECGVISGVALAVIMTVVAIILLNGGRTDSSSSAPIAALVSPTTNLGAVSGGGSGDSPPASTATASQTTFAVVAAGTGTVAAATTGVASQLPTAVAFPPTSAAVLPAPLPPTPTARTFAVLGFAALSRNVDKPTPADALSDAVAGQPLYLYIQVAGQTQNEDLIIQGLPGGDVPIKISQGQPYFIFPLEKGLPAGSYKFTLLYAGKLTDQFVELNVLNPTPTPLPPTATPTPLPFPTATATRAPTVTPQPSATPTNPPANLGTVNIAVLNANGIGLNGISVTVSGVGDTRSGATGFNGAVTFNLPEGFYNITALCSGGAVYGSTRSIANGSVNVTVRCPS